MVRLFANFAICSEGECFAKRAERSCEASGSTEFRTPLSITLSRDPYAEFMDSGFLATPKSRNDEHLKLDVQLFQFVWLDLGGRDPILHVRHRHDGAAIA